MVIWHALKDVFKKILLQLIHIDIFFIIRSYTMSFKHIKSSILVKKYDVGTKTVRFWNSGTKTTIKPKLIGDNCNTVILVG